jgi:phospholipid/cholesterol/gamma-HCH transport system substrate-binding protein
VTRGLLVRILVLIAVTLLGAWYIAFEAVGVVIINRPLTVRVDLPQAGGIYTNAYVTYRGVEVGKVTRLTLEPNMVVVSLAIRHGEKIPADSDASVRELTAAGEQYMDLVPRNTDPPYLTAGSVIPEDHTSIPVSVGQLLNTVDALVNSLPAGDLNTVTSALAQGLQGAGDDLRSIIVDGRTLLEALQSASTGTAQVIDAGNTVLNTFNATSNYFAQFSANLNSLSAQVAASNADLTKLLQNGSAGTAALERFLTANSASTASLLQNLATVTDVSFQRSPAFQALFEVLPLFATDIASTSSGGQLRFELNFNYSQPICSYTGILAQPNAVVPVAGLTGNCNTENPNLLQRGADKAPPPLG